MENLPYGHKPFHHGAHPYMHHCVYPVHAPGVGFSLIVVLFILLIIVGCGCAGWGRDG